MGGDVIGDGFAFKDVKVQESKVIIGYLRNDTGKSYSRADFYLFLVHETDELMRAVNLTIKNIRAGEVKSFQTPLPEIPLNELKEIRIGFIEGSEE